MVSGKEIEVSVRTVLVPLLVLVAASLAPPALAGRPDDRAGARDPGAIGGQLSSSVRPDGRAGARAAGVYEAAELATAVRPDDRGGARGPGTVGSLQLSLPARPDDRDGVRGPGALTTVVVQPASTAFDWGDALIGSLGGIGMALMLTGVLFLVMGRRRKARIA
jgi:hypothetical protein